MGTSNKLNYRNELIAKMGAEVNQKEVTVGVIKTAYLEAGKGYPVLFIHGAGAGAVTWYPSIGDVAQNFQAIVPDIVGYGESDKPDAPYDRPFFSKWLNGFLEELKIPKAHVVGLSQGGAIAMQFAIDYPEKVDRLVLVDSAGLGAKVSFWPLITMIGMNTVPSQRVSRYNSPYILHDPQKRDSNHSLYSIAVLKSDGGKKAFQQGRGAATTKIAEEALRQIKNKTLLIWGKEDKLFLAEYGEAAAKIIPNARFVAINDAGHLPLMDQPEVFNATLIDFLMEV